MCRRCQGRSVPHIPIWIVLGALSILQLLASRATASDWVLPDSRIGIRTAPLLLLTRPDVQTDLRLDRQQVAGAQETINELTRRAAALKGKTGAAVVAERRAIDEAQLDWLGKNLTGNQLERLRQIELQWEGVSAMLSRPSVADYLKLTTEQRQTLARVIAEQNALRRGAAAATRDDQALAQKAQAVLNQTQQELWGGLLGAPVRFATTTVPPRSRDDATQQAGHVEPKP